MIKPCYDEIERREYFQEYYKQNKLKLRQNAKAYYYKNKEKICEKKKKERQLLAALRLSR